MRAAAPSSFQGAQIEAGAPAHLGEPGGLLGREVGAARPGQLDEIDRGHPLAQGGAGVLVLEVLDDLPLAVLALDVGGGKDEQEQARMAQALQDAVVPVLHVVDVVEVEEADELLPGEGAVVLPDALQEFTHPALGVVLAGVGDEEVVGHGGLGSLGFVLHRGRGSVAPGRRSHSGGASCRTRGGAPTSARCPSWDLGLGEV